MRRRLASLVGVALALVARAAAAEGLLAADDARACAPLPGGGVAVATGGGLVLVSAEGAARVVTSRDGLPESRVHALAADGDAVWVGTDAGAARVAVSSGRVERTVGRTPVHAVVVAPGEGTLVGTWGEGLLRVGEKGAVSTVVPAAVARRVTGIAVHEGAIWVSRADAAPARIEGGALRASAGLPMHGQAVLGGARGEDLLVGDLEGLFRAGARSPLSNADARGIARGADGAVLVATWGEGLLAMRGAPARLERVEGVPREVRAIATLGGARCAATTSGALLDRGDGRFARVALGAGAVLPSNDVTALAPDATGEVVAVGTFDRGAVLVESATLRARPVPGVHATDTVNALAWQGDVLWVGTAQGLVRVAPDGVSRRFTARDGLPNGMIRALLVDGARVVVGTDEGPAFVTGESVAGFEAITKGRGAALTSPMHATWALAKADDGALLFGTMSGLYRASGKTVTRASVATGALDDDWVTALAMAGGDVLVGTYAHGVTRLDGATLEAKARLGGGYVNPAGVRAFAGRVFAATMDGLLSRPLDGEGAWQTASSAAPGADVTAVAAVKGARWVASRRGVAITR